MTISASPQAAKDLAGEKLVAQKWNLLRARRIPLRAKLKFR
jgi:hypothetical protein